MMTLQGVEADDFRRGEGYLLSLATLVGGEALQKVPGLETLSTTSILMLPGFPEPVASAAAGGRLYWSRRQVLTWWRCWKGAPRAATSHRA